MNTLARNMKRHLYFAIGTLALILGFIGIFMPVIPTAPFVIVAAWGFAQSSPRVDRWLRSHKHFGKAIRDWEERRAVPRLGKIAATAALSVSLPFTAWMLGAPYWWASALVITVCLCVLIWLWRLPDA